MATRAWLHYLFTTSKDKWEQEWELERLFRRPDEPAEVSVQSPTPL